MASNQRVAIYPGTFDPITNGHLDIIRRAVPLFDRVIVTLAVNSDKEPLFTQDERLEMIRRTTEDIDSVDVSHFSGLVVDFAKSVGAVAVIRGLRAISDFEYEFQIALMNRKLSPKVDTVFLMPAAEYTYLSSSIVREIARHNGKIDCFVPNVVEEMLKVKFGV
ncbi:MAG: pantetheine-phosphate adenylyltransferase [Candidatus Electryoneaceae bacterium]|nr:pantetheine-phosphate adenylyltransferase [Candidatus Electryoneaceae bacterium]